MFVFPKSIADPSAPPVAGFVASQKPTVKSGVDPDASFGRNLEVAQAASAQAAAGTSASRSELGLDNDNSEDKFLTLLIAQMRNQDPLNPLDNAEVTSQLAQINTVRGIEKLNESISGIIGRMGEPGALDAAALIGREVMVEGDLLVIGADGAPSSLSAAFELAEPAEQVVLDVFDATGMPVASLALTDLDAGVHPFQWDGRDGNGDALEAGEYFFLVSAVDADGPIDAVPLAPAQVAGVVRQGSDFALQLASGHMVERQAVRGVR